MVVTAKRDGALGPLEERWTRSSPGGGGGRAPEELERALAQVEAAFVESLERVGGFGGKADRLNEYAVFTGDPAYLGRDLARYRAVDLDDLRDAARRWLVEPSRVTLSVVPRGRPELAAEGRP